MVVILFQRGSSMKRNAMALMLALVVAIAAGSGYAQARKAEKPEKTKDPVCGMMVDKDPKLSTTFKGETYYFCSKADMDEFKKTPDKFARKS
jgi:YHS domain-containing protein